MVVLEFGASHVGVDVLCGISSSMLGWVQRSWMEVSGCEGRDSAISVLW
jgi:hypothetical protein